jgi:hypothetical protein
LKRFTTAGRGACGGVVYKPVFLRKAEKRCAVFLGSKGKKTAKPGLE